MYSIYVCFFVQNVVTIRDFREKLSEKESVPLKSLLVVDKENGVLYQDATVFEPCKKERYTLMVGNKNRTQGFKEDGNVHTDVISNKQISHGKCQMCCGHFTGKFLMLSSKRFLKKSTQFFVKCLSLYRITTLLAGMVYYRHKFCYILHTKKITI